MDIKDANDLLLNPLPSAVPPSSLGTSAKANLALELLGKTQLSQDRIQNQFETKVQHKSLLLHPASRAPDTRVVKAEREARRRDAKRKPRPLSAKEKRVRGLHAIPKSAQDYALFQSLNVLWTSYIQEILKGGGNEAKLIKADYHGARLTVVKCSCPSLVFLTGIVIKETRHTFVICTVENEIKTIPKKSTIFEFQVELTERGILTPEEEASKDVMKWEIFGEHFGYRAAERVGKKFKGKQTVDF